MRILALSGGGFQALYTVRLLERLERENGPLLGVFDRFCGTSAGAIVASAAACGIPMSELAEGFVERGALAFRPRRGLWGRDLWLRFSTAKYNSAPLAALITEAVGIRTMGEMEGRLAVTATRLRDGTPLLFTSTTHPRERVRRLVLASAAAPTMFPAVRVAGDLYTDGALFANAPDLLALDWAAREAPEGLAECRMLSIGAMNRLPPLTEPEDPDMGVLDWLRGNRVFRTMMGAQAVMTEHLAQGLMGERYTRIDAPTDFALRHAVALDRADDLAIEAARMAASISAPALNAWMMREGLV